MAAIEPVVAIDKVDPTRYLRNPKVVYIRELSDDCYLVTDLNDKNEYVISRLVLDREYEEI